MPNVQKQVFAWSDAGRVAPERLEEALLVSGAWPGAADWLRFATRLAWVLGAVWLAAGVVFFFAFNWAALPRWAKFALVEGALVAATAAAVRAGIQRTAGQAGLLGATIVLGALLALFGQTYQTGADPYQLFTTWAALALPWVIVARWSVLWMFWLLLVNVGIGLYFSSLGAPAWLDRLSGDQALLWTELIVNGVALAAWELGRGAGLGWMQARWPARLLAWGTGCVATAMGLWAVFEPRYAHPGLLVGYFGWMAAVWVAYRWKGRDLVILSGWVLSGIIFATAALVQLFGLQSTEGFFLVSLMVLGLAVVGARWLRGLAAREGEPS
jgi:uncharacterized membrane protein